MAFDKKEQDRKDSRDTYYWLKAHHRCTRCWKQDAYTLKGKIYCYECTEKRKEEYSLNKQKHAERHKSYIFNLINKGLCPRCRKPTDRQGKICTECLAKRRVQTKAKDIERRRKKQIENNINFPRGENGFCYLCNKRPAMDGRKLCSECYDKICANAAKGREHIDYQNQFWRQDNKLCFSKRQIKEVR